MSVEQMRARVSKVYDSWRWRDKVAHMGDNQIIAIYHSFSEKGKFDKPKSTRLPGERYRQMTIFDFGISK